MKSDDEPTSVFIPGNRQPKDFIRDKVERASKGSTTISIRRRIPEFCQSLTAHTRQPKA